MASRGRGKRKWESEEESGSRKEPETEECRKLMEQVNEVLSQLKEQITPSNEHLLTMGDPKSFDISLLDKDTLDILLSWKFKRPELIAPHCSQKEDDCWAHAFARALTAVMKQHGYTGKLPTVPDLKSWIDSKFLSATSGLPRSEDAATLFRDHYKCEFIVHHRPKLTLVQENEEFSLPKLTFLDDCASLVHCASSFS